MKRLVLAVLAILPLCSTMAQNTAGTEFRFAFLDNLDPAFNEPPVFDIVVNGEPGTEVTLSYEASNLLLNEVIDTSRVARFSLDDTLYYEQGAQVTSSASFHLNATSEVKVTAFHKRVFFSEATTVLPIDQLDSEYFILAGKDELSPANPSSASIIAMENGTSVTIMPSVGLSTGEPASQPLSITLDAGQVFTLKSDGEDLTGTSVSATAPVAVFAGAKQGEVSCSGADSHMYDQVWPVSKWGKTYAHVPFAGQGQDKLKILAAENGTIVQLNCGEQTYELEAGESTTLMSGEASLITSNKSISVAQFMTGADCNPNDIGDPNMIVLPPLNFFSQAAKVELEGAFDSNSLSDVESYNINLVVPTAQISNLEISSASVSFTPFSSNQQLSYAQLAFSSFENAIDISSSSGFYGIAYAAAAYDSYSWSLGADTEVDLPFDSGEPVAIEGPEQICPEDTATLSVANPNSSIEYSWSTGETGTSIQITEDGEYWVQANQGCTVSADTTTVGSGPVPLVDLPDSISLCADQVDTLDATVSGAISYNWSTGQIGPIIFVDEPGTYSVTVSGSFCDATASVDAVPGKKAELILPNDTTTCPGKEVTLVAESMNGDAFWSATGGPRLTTDDPGIYRAVAVNDCGSDTSYVSIGEGECGCRVYTPNVFTPNSDGLNDQFKVEYECEFAEFKLVIFNRWGNEVFRSNDPDKGWNGAVDGYLVPTGVYMYSLRYVNNNTVLKSPVQRTGSLTLIR